ncbi:molybdenum ABC transporter ATP-binding protein [Magnetovibrio sp. PR-2]|uniref:molybdenum ABC transporter ATP-binding protein n=1 Tax=Magnetovibrio sp. PR-2 TaxID=3120356 RepID=UPI002FCDFE52
MVDTNTIDACFRGQKGDFVLDVDFSVPAQGVTALYGPSGCGKTSVLRCIAGLEQMTYGRLSVKRQIWQDTDSFLPPHKRAIGYVFQEASLFAHLSVHGNLIYASRRVAQGAAGPSFDEVVDLLGLEGLLERSPANLSGGERQRVAIGRALLSQPEIMLMDEPLSALDRFGKNEILPYLERLHDRLEMPVLYVSHDIIEIERLADRMVLLEDGKVLANDTLEKVLSDPGLPLARMPDAAAVVDGHVQSFDEQYGLTTLTVEGGELIVPGEIGPIGAVQRVRIAASDVGLCRVRAPQGSSILNGPLVRIEDVEQSGPYKMTVFLRFGEKETGAPLLARITRKSWDVLELQPGDVVHALIKSVSLTDTN